LAMCPAGPGEMDFLTAVGAASELISGVALTLKNRDEGLARLTEVYGKPPSLTEKGRQLASVQIETSGGQRPFALEGLATRFIENVSSAASIPSRVEWDSVATNVDIRYALDETLGLTVDAFNARVRRKAIDGAARSRSMYDEVVPFDGRFERPVMTIH